ncbi:MAG: glycosyltransferase family 4 protein [Terrimicrobiaceae bacterium]|nr:glycosyltransferase family 4 protein [Terrimicrobiaceae bacterium]
MSLTVSLTRVPRRIGFISTRFHGTDGVTLEAAKWAHIFEAEGAACYWMAGQLDKPAAVSHLEPLAFFNHPEILDVQRRLFAVTTRSRALTDQVHAIKERLKSAIYAFIERFELELLIPQNILAIPMHIPLGLAMTEVIAETGIATVAHHHDFTWERERFTVTAGADYLAAAFPPTLPSLEHVVINSMQQKELARRYGQASSVIPNVIDFETPPPGIDDYTRDFRSEIGLAAEDILVLQPTRLVARKGIEHSIELLRRLKDPRCKLVFSHPPGDEGDAYFDLLRERIADAGIEAVMIWDRVGEARGVNDLGKKIYTLNDIYPHADLVTYPSHYEGFGNAFLEAIYFGRPVVVNAYAVYARDIDPLGFRCIEMSQLVTNEVVEQTRAILADAELREEWAVTNFRLGLKFFSYSVARRKLAGRLASLFGEG